MALAAVVGLWHQPNACTNLAPVAEVPPEQLEREARRAHFTNPSKRARSSLRLRAGAGTLACRVFSSAASCCCASASRSHSRSNRSRNSRGSGAPFVALHLVTSEAAREVLVIDLIPAAERGQQFAHAVAMLQCFLLQLPAITHELALRLVTRRPHCVFSMT